jgi:hypothetical protein
MPVGWCCTLFIQRFVAFRGLEPEVSDHRDCRLRGRLLPDRHCHGRYHHQQTEDPNHGADHWRGDREQLTDPEQGGRPGHIPGGDVLQRRERPSSLQAETDRRRRPVQRSVEGRFPVGRQQKLPHQIDTGSQREKSRPWARRRRCHHHLFGGLHLPRLYRQGLFAGLPLL